MATFTLDSIRDAAAEKYSSTDIALSTGETVVLLNPLRLPKDKRKKLMSIQDDIDGEDVEQEEVLADAILLVAENADLAGKLLKEVGDDMAVLAEIFSRYTGGVSLGEASASQN